MTTATRITGAVHQQARYLAKQRAKMPSNPVTARCSANNTLDMQDVKAANALPRDTKGQKVNVEA